MTEIRSTILIIDDIPENIQVIGNILKTKDYQIEFALTPSEALDWVVSKSFDLIILDIMMPEMNGIDLCRLIKKNSLNVQTPIIFVTAKNDIDSLTKAFEAGGVDYITKPFNSLELLVRVNNHILIQNQKNELMMLNATKNKFLSIIAHDLRNPLNNLLGFGELLERNILNYTQEKQLSFVKIMNDTTNNILRLLENLLAWAQSQTGKLTPKPESIRISKIANWAISVLELDALRKELVIENKLDKETLVFADFQMISTIIRNLLSNAIKFSKKGGYISIHSEAQDQFELITVKDHGVGMEEESLERMFKIEENISTTGTANEKGSGLGLILCREFVEKNGGKIGVKSQLNLGAEFYFSLPKESLK